MRILLFYDNMIRDYRGLLLLSEILKRRGHRTWVTPLWDRPEQAMQYYRPDTIVMGQVGEETTSAAGHFARENGINVVLNTTENVCYEGRKQYFFKTNFREWNESLIDLQVIIGRDFDQYVQDHAEIRDKSKYRFIGCPRFDLSVHPEICLRETEHIQQKYGLSRFNVRHLYISSFIFDPAGGQASQENRQFIDISQRLAREVEQKRQHHGILTRLVDDLRRTNGVLLIKRHPWDKSDYYFQHYRGDHIIIVDNHDYIVPLLQVSDAVFHTESTVAIEGWIQRKKTISLLPDFDGDRRNLKNHMGHEPIARDYSEVTALLRSYPWERTDRSLEMYKPYIDGKATERLADAILMLPVRKPGKPFGFTERQRAVFEKQRIEEKLTYAARLKRLQPDQYLYHFLYLEQFRRRIDHFYRDPILTHIATHAAPGVPESVAAGAGAVLRRAADDYALGRDSAAVDRLGALVGGDDDGCRGRAHLLVARCRWRLGQAPAARWHFERAVAAAADDPDPRKGFARFLAETGDVAAAADQCRQVFDRRPDDVDAVMMLADLAKCSGKPSLSQDLARQALTIEPGHPEALALLQSAGDGDGAYRSVIADADLGNLPALASSERFGRWAVRFRGLTIRCHDLLSFYIAAKDIFLQRIYDFTAVRPDPVVIDGGGHIGLFSLYVKQKYPRARVTVFEPDAESLALLRANLSANGAGDVAIVPAGLFSRDGHAAFGSDHSDGSSLFSTAAGGKVPVVRLGPYLSAGVDYLKLNIEGAELDVLADAAGELARVRELVMEYHGFPEIGQRLHRILHLLDQKGFRYLVNDFDAHTNPATKPPFRLEPASRFFLLVYARRLFDAAENRTGETGDVANGTAPVSRTFGLDRGAPIDRYYIEAFLGAQRRHIRGRVLEIGDDGYTRRFGSGVTRADVLSAEPAPGVTVVGDLASGAGLTAAAYDCIILTQTLQFIYDVRAALASAVRSLKPGGRLLITASGISQISRYDMDRWGEYWRFTDRSLARLLKEAAPGCAVGVRAHGNVAVAKAFLDGRACQELDPGVLDHQDPDYQVVLTATVSKPESPECAHGLPAKRRGAGAGPSVLIYHRVAEDPVDAQLLAVSPAHFAAHLRHLADHCQVVGLDQLMAAVENGAADADMVAVTFDDGYADNLIRALPVIEACRVPVTMFVTSGAVDSPTEFWWDALEHLFFEGPLPARLDISLDGRPDPVATGSPQERIDAYTRLCGRLRGAPFETIRERLPVLFARAARPPACCAPHRRLTSAELAALARSPWIEIGAHSVNHTRLSALPPETQMREIYLSKRQLEEITGTRVRYFSYPFGTPEDFDETTAAIVRECGFAGGIANIQRRVTAPVDRYRIPRRLVRNWPGAVFARWLSAPDGGAQDDPMLAARNARLMAILTHGTQSGGPAKAGAHV